MAVFLKNTESYSPAKAIKIIRNEMAEDHTVYIIEINLGPFKWNVCKRYNEFYELNEKLIGQIPSLDRDLLPKKKIFGNNSEPFIKKRQHQLEIYLQSLFRSFETLPAVLLKFLEFHKYEIHGIVEILSEDFYEKGDQILSSNNFSTLTTLQLNALCTRLQLPEPTCGSYNMKRDLGHLLDFVTRVKFLQVLGHSLPFGTSNIIPNELSYHFQHFKSLESLKFSNCRMERVKIEDNVKKHLKQLYVCKTLSALKEILMSGVHWTENCSEMPTQLLDACSWPNVTLANFNDNKIECIDDSIKLLPHLEQLSLVRNKLQEIEHLYHLSFLRSIDLSSNYISNLESLHIKLGNVTCLNLSRNRISTLSGFQKMYSLQKLNLSYNSLLQKEEIYHLRQLPNLDYLDTRKNPMAKNEGYRVDVYEMFGERAQDIILDKKAISSRELNLVLVRLALSKSKAGRSPDSLTSSSDSRSESKPVTEEHSTVSRSKMQSIDSTPVSQKSSSAPSDSSEPAAIMSTSQILLPGVEVTKTATPTENTIKSNPNLSFMQNLKQSTKSRIKCTTASTLFSFPTGHQHPSNTLLLGKKNGTKSQKNFFLLPDTLPGHNNKALITEIESILNAAVQRGTCDVDPKKESPVHVMWCSAYFNLTPKFLAIESDRPCCVYVTPYNIHLLEVKKLNGDASIPLMQYFASISFSDILCILVGYRSMYMRLVLNCVETPIDVVFLTFSLSKTHMFLSHLKRAYRRSVPNLDEYEDPLVYYFSKELEHKIYTILQPYEMNLNVIFDSNAKNNIDITSSNKSDSNNSTYVSINPTPIKLIQFYCLVQLIVAYEEPDQGKTSALIATNENLYVCHQNFTFFPPFILEPEHKLVDYTRSKHCISDNTVACVFPINSRIINLQMYDANVMDLNKVKNSKNKPSFDLISDNGFIGYGLKMTFNLGIYGVQTLDLRWPSSNMRDTFLHWFAQFRNEIKDVSSSSSFPMSRKKNKKKKKVASPDWENRHLQFDTQLNQNDTFPYALTVQSDDDVLDQDISFRSFKHLPNESEKYSVPGTGGVNFEAIKSNKDKYDLIDRNVYKSTVPTEFSETYIETKVCPAVEMSNATGRLEASSLDSNKIHNSSMLSEHEIRANSNVEMENSKHVLYSSRIELTLNELKKLDVFEKNLVHEKIPSEVISDDAMSRMKCCLADISNLFSNFEISFPDEESLTDYYELNVAQPGEVAHFFLFTNVILFTNPSQEIPSCVILTDRYVHFISNSGLLSSHFKTFYSVNEKRCILLDDRSKEKLEASQLAELEVYLKIDLQQLGEVNLGMFGEFFRLLVQNDRNSIACCITRDNLSTQMFLNKLLDCLSKIRPVLPVEVQSPYEMYKISKKHRLNPDNYSIFRHSMTGSYDDVVVYYDVSFIYPSDETLTDIASTMDNKLSSVPLDWKIYFYLACHLISVENITNNSAHLTLHPVNLLITENSVAILEEDYVSYPSPRIHKFPPDKPQFISLATYPLSQVLKVASIVDSPNILRIFVSDAETTDEIKVDVDLDHFASVPSGVSTHKTEIEILKNETFFTFFIHKQKDIDLFLNVIGKRWTLCNKNEIPFVRTSLIS